MVRAPSQKRWHGCFAEIRRPRLLGRTTTEGSLNRTVARKGHHSS